MPISYNEADIKSLARCADRPGMNRSSARKDQSSFTNPAYPKSAKPELSGPISEITVGLRCQEAWPNLATFGWRSDRSWRMESHDGRPIPADRLALPAEFVDYCRRLVRRPMVCYSQHQRARLALLLHESPDSSNVAAGSAAGLHANSVRLWRHHWASGHFFPSFNRRAVGASPLFPPRNLALVKAIACEAVCQTKLSVSPRSVWRILGADAIKPWRYEYWIFPLDR
jgi:hypothetical protein